MAQVGQDDMQSIWGDSAGFALLRNDSALGWSGILNTMLFVSSAYGCLNKQDTIGASH